MYIHTHTHTLSLSLSFFLSFFLLLCTRYGRLLETERWTNFARGRLQYRLAVPTAGAYQVKLVFVEMWHRNPGTRVFDVNVQGNTVFRNMDIVAEAGFQTPITKVNAHTHTCKHTRRHAHDDATVAVYKWIQWLLFLGLLSYNTKPRISTI